MTDATVNLPDGLEEIKKSLEENLESLEKIKQNADTEFLPEIEKIERSGWQAVMEIEDLTKKIRRQSAAVIERNTILTRTGSKTPYRMRKVGRLWA